MLHRCFQDVTVAWQQKIFSQSEVDFYSRSRVSDFEQDVLKKKFYHDVQAQVMMREAAATASHDNNSPKQHVQICTEIDGEFANDFDLVGPSPNIFLFYFLKCESSPLKICTVLRHLFLVVSPRCVKMPHMRKMT